MLLLCGCLLFSLFWRRGSYTVLSFGDRCFHTLAFSLRNFIALCLMESLSWKKHKPAENQKCFLLSAKGQVQAFIMCAVYDWDDTDQFWEDFSWHRAGVVGMSLCPAPHICLLLSSWRGEERRMEPPFTLLFPTGRIEGASGSHL